MARSISSTAPTPQEVEASADDEQDQTVSNSGAPKKPSRKRRFAQVAFKTAAITSGLDVIARDVRRIRPVNPQLWRDVFSRKGLSRLKKNLSNPAQFNSTTPQKRSAIARIIVPSLVTAVIGILVAVYAVAFVQGLGDISATPIYNRVAILVAMVFGSFLALVNVLIAGMTVVKLNNHAKAGRK